MHGIKRRRIAAGVRADAVFFADGGPVIVSGGRALKVALSTEAQAASISLACAESGTLADLASGGVDDMAKAYSTLCSDLRRGSRSGWRAFSLGAAVGAVLTASVFGAISASIVAGAWRSAAATANEASMPAQPAGLPGLAKMQELLPALEEFGKRGEAAQAGTGQPSKAGIPLPEDVRKAPTAGGFNPVAIPDGLPPYAAPTSAATPAPAAAKADGEAKKEQAQAPEKPAAPDSAPLQPFDESAAAPKPESKKPDEKAEAPAAAKAPGEPAAAEQSDKEKAKAAAQSLLDKGFTKDQAIDVLSQLQKLGNVDPSKITPEMLSKLPHEVARMLVDNGFAGGDDAPDGVNYSIIRVPESVVDAHRGQDGISDIPERNTWASTGNYVSIPLPGGGDVKEPADLESFHLKP